MRSALKWSLALGALAVLLAAGCARKERGHNYIVRGQVVELPSPANGNLLQFHHEAVDDFVTREGKVEGMDSMTMPFLVARNVPLRDIKPGDKIEVILHVDWQADRAVEITGLRKLAPGQKLDFRAAHPPGKP
ncbi:MAG TPA: copper-binding protein [Thermoanaerobaculia bacterium]